LGGSTSTTRPLPWKTQVSGFFLAQLQARPTGRTGRQLPDRRENVATPVATTPRTAANNTRSADAATSRRAVRVLRHGSLGGARNSAKRFFRRFSRTIQATSGSALCERAVKAGSPVSGSATTATLQQ